LPTESDPPSSHGSNRNQILGLRGLLLGYEDIGPARVLKPSVQPASSHCTHTAGAVGGSVIDQITFPIARKAHPEFTRRTHIVRPLNRRSTTDTLDRHGDGASAIYRREQGVRPCFIKFESSSCVVIFLWRLDGSQSTCSTPPAYS